MILDHFMALASLASKEESGYSISVIRVTEDRIVATNGRLVAAGEVRERP